VGYFRDVPRDRRPPAGSWERDERAVAWVYGSILVGAAVVVAANVIASRPGQVVIYTATTMVVVWLVHSYAAFVGHGGRIDLRGLRGRVAHALNAELPVLACSIPTLAATALSALLGAGVATTGLVGLIASIATMAVVAARTARRAGAGALGVAAATASALLFGLLLVVAKVSLK
jgi:hypothetical protein